MENVDRKKKHKNSQQGMPLHPSWVSKDGVWGHYIRKNGNLEFVPEYQPSKEDMKNLHEIMDILEKDMFNKKEDKIKTINNTNDFLDEVILNDLADNINVKISKKNTEELWQIYKNPDNYGKWLLLCRLTEEGKYWFAAIELSKENNLQDLSSVFDIKVFEDYRQVKSFMNEYNLEQFGIVGYEDVKCILV